MIRIRYSDDKGSTWSDASTISISYGRQNWFPWICIDDLTGIATVIYYSFDQATGVSTNTYVAYSADGVTWQNIKVSDVAHNTAIIPGNFSVGYSGDYIGIASFSGSAFATWMDDRNGTWQIYLSKVDFNLPSLASSQTNLDIDYPSNIYGNISYQASQKIRVANAHSVTIKSTGNVKMVAGTEIALLPGFATDIGAEFEARIASVSPCTTPGAILFRRAPSGWNSELNVIKQEPNKIRIFAYPNPSTEFVTIGVMNDGFHSASLIITNILGKVVEVFQSPDIGKEQIRQVVNVTTYPIGAYIASYEIDGNKYSLKFIKQ